MLLICQFWWKTNYHIGYFPTVSTYRRKFSIYRRLKHSVFADFQSTDASNIQCTVANFNLPSQTFNLPVSSQTVNLPSQTFNLSSQMFNLPSHRQTVSVYCLSFSLPSLKNRMIQSPQQLQATVASSSSFNLPSHSCRPMVDSKYTVATVDSKYSCDGRLKIHSCDGRLKIQLRR